MVSATNVNPTATAFTGPLSAVVSANTTFAFSGVTDAGSDDVIAEVRSYAYDFNNDGTWEVGNGTYVGSIDAASQDHVFPSTGMFTVRRPNSR